MKLESASRSSLLGRSVLTSDLRRALAAVACSAHLVLLSSAASAATFTAITKLPPNTDLTRVGTTNQFFVYLDSSSGFRATDGTADTALGPKAGSSFSPYRVVSVGGKILFTYGSKFWATAGTPQTTLKIADVGLDDRGWAVLAPNHFIFSTMTYEGPNLDPTHHLWSVDGTVAGTKQIGHLKGDDDDYRPRGAQLGNRTIVVLETSYGAVDQGVWLYEGTSLTPIFPKRHLRAPISCGAYVYFLSGPNKGGSDEAQPGWWRTDGTVAGTMIVSRNDQNASVEAGFCVGNHFIFAHDYDTLLSSTGGAPVQVLSKAGERPNVTINGPEQTFGGSYLTTTTYGSDNSKSKLYWTDGTAAGTILVAETSANAAFHYVGTNKAGQMFATTTEGMLVTDGTAAGTRVIPLPANLLPDVVAVVASPTDDRLFFWMSDTSNATVRYPWVTDGTAAGTGQLANFKTGGKVSGGKFFAIADGQLFTIVNDGSSGDQVYALRVAPSNVKPGEERADAGTAAVEAPADTSTDGADGTSDGSGPSPSGEASSSGCRMVHRSSCDYEACVALGLTGILLRRRRRLRPGS